MSECPMCENEGYTLRKGCPHCRYYAEDQLALLRRERRREEERRRRLRRGGF